MVLRWFRVWVAITMGAFATGVVNSATVHYDGDTILGVSGLVSRGETYNVEFKDGSCASLFSGCDSPSDFAFFDSQQAVDAIFSLHSALAGADDTRVRGCGGGYPCTRYTPFFTPERYFSARDGGWIEARFGLNRSRGNAPAKAPWRIVAVRRFCEVGDEAIRLVHQRSSNHGHHHPGGHAAASTHARRHAHAQAGAQDAGSLHPRRAQADRYLGRSPDTATVEDLRNFQLHLVDTGTSPITLNATLTGLKFFFDITLGRGELMAKMQPVKLPRTLPVVLSREEVSRADRAPATSSTRRRLSVAYGAGLRASEVIRLKVGDVDSQRMTLRVEQGKGAKDRYAMLSPVLLQRLRTWWRVGHAQGKMLPGGWLFPGMDPMDPLTPGSSTAPCTTPPRPPASTSA
jgi:hypothetical protein